MLGYREGNEQRMREGEFFVSLKNIDPPASLNVSSAGWKKKGASFDRNRPRLQSCFAR